ncbi:MAG: hypothetical protein EBS89_06460 [Proteobacteria bacterium]|nr:hypothetical protein [Pseudomonadota bacterium]
MPHNSPFPYIIAEIGASHDGSLTRAHTLIHDAAQAGVQAVKFQIYDTDRLCARRNAEPYRRKYAQYQVPLEWLKDLRDTAHQFQVDLVLSVYDTQDLDAVQGYADQLKVASFEAGDFGLIQACVATGKPVIVSTGMSGEADMLRLRLSCKMLGNVSLLHCVSAYPARMGDLNLSVIKHYRLDGFSDHSRNVLTGALAVSHGAKIVEVHLRGEDTPSDNPDYPHALTGSELATYVFFAHQAHAAVGERQRKIYPCEMGNTAYKVRS